MTAEDLPAPVVTGVACHGGGCVTCSDEAVPVTVVRLLDDGFAEVDTGAGIEEISVALVAPQPGETVLVHAGEAITIVRE